MTNTTSPALTAELAEAAELIAEQLAVHDQLLAVLAEGYTPAEAAYSAAWSWYELDTVDREQVADAAAALYLAARPTREG